MSTLRPVVAVIGGARVESPEQEALAVKLGATLMEGGFRLVTGGLGGVMEAASRGARSSPAWEDGRVIGVVPSYQHAEANEHCDIVIPTGAQVGRNLLVVASGHAVVAIGGGAGTMSEIALAWQLRRPVVALGDWGWAGRLAGEALDHRHDGRIHPAATAAEAVLLCGELWPHSASADAIRAH
jgi:hypothetical protein